MSTPHIHLPADPKRKAYIEAGVWNTSICLDHLFARNVRRAPAKIILCDPGDKQEISGTPALHLSAEACERIVNTLCMRFQELGLDEGQVVAVQMPNTVELPLTLLACLRCGLIPALLPLLWAEKDIHAALDLLHPKAIISVTRASTLLPADKLRYAAASLFSVRYLMAFGPDTVDGVISLQDVMESPLTPKGKTSSFAGKADNPALITFRFTTLGPAPVIRSHNHAMSVALMPMLEGQMEPEDEVILSCLQPSSLIGLATGFLPWLLSGGRLVLHQANTASNLVDEVIDEKITCAAIPAPVLNETLTQLAGESKSLKSIFAVYPNAATPPALTNTENEFRIIDCHAFDEFAVVARAREGNMPRPVQPGAQIAPSTGIGPSLVEFALSPTTSRLMIRGPGTPYNPERKDGFQQTGYLAKFEADRISFLGRADQIAFVGGLAVPLNEVGSAILNMEGVEAVQMNTLADPVFGEIVEARIYFARSSEPQEQRIGRIKKEFESQMIAAYKMPARFVIDPLIVNQKTTLHRPQKKAV